MKVITLRGSPPVCWSATDRGGGALENKGPMTDRNHGRARKRIVYIDFGGTFNQQTEKGGNIIDAPGSGAEDLLERIKKTVKVEIIEGKIENFKPVDSTEITQADFEKLIETIRKRCRDDDGNYVDGIVITHGTNTMAETAARLSFMLSKPAETKNGMPAYFPVPIVLTGSAQQKQENKKWDGERNFRDAFIAAKHMKAGVYVTFKGKVILGCKAHKNNAHGDNAFESINYPDIARITYDGNFRIKKRPGLRLDDRFQAPGTHMGYTKNIKKLSFSQGVDPTEMEKEESKKSKGVIIQGVGQGAVAKKWLELIKALEQLGIPVLMNSDCEGGRVEGKDQMVAKEKNTTYRGAMSNETAIVKFKMAVEIYDNCTGEDKFLKIKEYMETDIAGETLYAKKTPDWQDGLLDAFNTKIGKYACTVMVLGTLIVGTWTYAADAATDHLLIWGERAKYEDALPAHCRADYKLGIPYTDINFSKYDAMVFGEYRKLSAEEEKMIANYISFNRPVVLISGVPGFFAAGPEEGEITKVVRDENDEADLTSMPWIGATKYGNNSREEHTKMDAFIVEDRPFGSELRKGDKMASEAPENNGAIPKGSLLPGAEIIATWDNGKTYAYRYGNVFWMSPEPYAGSGSENNLVLFRAALTSLIDATKKPDDPVTARLVQAYNYINELFRREQ
ncbi:MAG: asparaginase domain-containing protein [Candidatus Burarchaeum sp.]|nr:asparaginase domain-containing protein [Candidatus Burarchaeum sp.]MDO8340014.1 asparaginase domain-containing protein [Candidatus Burarchaeum sp.]